MRAFSLNKDYYNRNLSENIDLYFQELPISLISKKKSIYFL